LGSGGTPVPGYFVSVAPVGAGSIAPRADHRADKTVDRRRASPGVDREVSRESTVLGHRLLADADLGGELGVRVHAPLERREAGWHVTGPQGECAGWQTPVLHRL